MGQSSSLRGFTIVELAVVVASAGTLLAFAAPTFGPLQPANDETRSVDMHRGLSKAQHQFMNDHQGDFSGPNTSGLIYNRVSLTGPTNPSVLSVVGDTTPNTPTVVGDWISPIVGDRAGLPTNRGQRLAAIFDSFGDPTATNLVDELFGTAPDIADFVSILLNGGFRQPSFLQLRSFTHLPHTTPSVQVNQQQGYIQRFFVQSPNDSALTSDSYRPNIAHVGTVPSQKVMFADGTRYLSEDGLLSLDINPTSPFHDFASAGPIAHASPAYGRSHAGAPDSLDLSFRKKGGSGLYASMFDGSVRFFTREQAWTDPTPWYPTGSVWTGIGATPESAQWVKSNLPKGIIN